ncbi:MAG: hypothetical protein R2698_01470 [Microthrixaceae bacterium]
MDIRTILAARLDRRGQGGFTGAQGMIGIALTATAALTLLGQSDERVDAAASTACAYEKTVVMTAVEAYTANNDFRPPVAAGPDGLDAVREAGWLRTVSSAWRYTGVDDKAVPQYETLPDGNCGFSSHEPVSAADAQAMIDDATATLDSPDLNTTTTTPTVEGAPTADDFR